MSIGSLFSGIGGLELGLERAGLGSVVWQAESNPYCQRVLAKHWPEARLYGDVKDINTEATRTEIICGGFPCQDISVASRGRGGGIEGQHSGLWREIPRVADALRPQWIVVENVDIAAWGRWVPLMRGALHEIGYPSMPIRLPALHCGAPFRGSRVFLVAKTNSHGQSDGSLHAQMAELPKLARPVRKDWGRPSSRAMGVADGLPNRTHRLEAVGNAVVPACAEVIGHMILQSCRQQQRLGER